MPEHRGHGPAYHFESLAPYTFAGLPAFLHDHSFAFISYDVCFVS